jgi:AcrR family transcriptional regulator
MERRKAVTRQKLIDVARGMLAAETANTASIQDITEAADLGFGTFYNHFTSKAELFQAAIDDVLEETGQLLDRLSCDSDPAVAFARSVRFVVRLGRSRPELAKVLVRHGPAYIDSDRGLAPRAMRDIRNGIASGRFQVDNERLAMACVAGSLLAVLHLSVTDPGTVDEAACDQFAEQMLRVLGVSRREARRLVAAPPPDDLNEVL